MSDDEAVAALAEHASEEELLIELAKRDLIDFEIATNPKYDPNWHHELIADKLMAVERGEIKRLMIFVPPRHGKSQQCSIDFPAHYLGRHPDGQIITTSYSSELAKDFGEQTRDLVASFEFQKIFSETRLKEDSTAKDKWKTDQGGYYIAVGVGGAITGRGAKIAIIDDPFKNREEAESQTMRDKVYNWYTSTLYTRLEPQGAIILIMCMTGDTPVLMADGAEKMLRDIRKGDKVATWADGRLSSSLVKNWISHGNAQVFAITTSSGKVVKANERHPFLISDNGKLVWKRVRDLRIAQQIVTLKGNGGNGKENFAPSVNSRLSVKGIVRRIIIKENGLMDTVLRQLIQNPVVIRVSNIVTELLLKGIKNFFVSRTVSVQFVKNLQEIMSAPIGVGNFASTTYMRRKQSEACSAMTVTSLSGTQRVKRPRWPWRHTSDFTLESIISIEDAGVEEVFDVQVDGTENFIANGVVSHNTRWHHDDLAARLLEDMKNGGDQWDIVDLPAIAEQDEEYRKMGEALWPKWFSLAALLEKKKAVGIRDWASLYQQKPIITESQEFKEENYRYFEDAELSGKTMSFTIAVDPAISKDESADRTGITVVGREVGKPDWYVMEALGARLDPLELIDTVFSLYNEYRKRGPVKVGIETVAYQKSLIYYMKEEMRSREEYIHLQELKNTNKKEERIRGLIPLFNTGVIHLKKTYSLLFEELATFPSGRNDDILDSLASHLEMQTPTSIRARRRLGRSPLIRERNPVTGY